MSKKKLNTANVEEIETMVLEQEPEIPEEKKEEPVIETPEVTEEIKEEPVIENSSEDELEDAFKKFQEDHSEHTVEETAQTVEEKKQVPPDSYMGSEISTADEFKVQMFLNLFFLLLDGVHSFIYGFFYKKYKISKNDIALDEDDKEGIEGYFKTKRVIELINKLPTELIGFIHIEYLYWQKFDEFKKLKEEEEKQKLLLEAEASEEEEEEIEEEEIEEEEPEKKQPPMKKRRYRKTGKYKKKKPEVKKKTAKKKKPTKKVTEVKKDE